MPSVLPLGDPAPSDGLLPAQALEGAAGRSFGLYVHIPFCAVRCGYCDFNTYTATELGGGASQDAYATTAITELAFAAAALKNSGLPERPLGTVFFGGGTPTLLPAEDLARILTAAIGAWGLQPGAEVTTEANPDSVTPESLQLLADAGFTRVSFGMQSAVPHVLKVLDRTHTPSRVPQVVQWAKEAGLAVSLDLIYGTPGESLADWRHSLETALSYEPDHISAYALIVEDGTKLAAQIRRGEVPGIDDDDHAVKYELADELISAAGLDWWGIGPGAHSHVGGVRWWNVKHPTAYAGRLGSGASPAAGRETLDTETRNVERVMLEARLNSGLEIAGLGDTGRHAVAGLIADGLVDPTAAFKGKLVLTLKGRLLADAVVRRILPD
jgi:coproporphyrinogen III oxidase-like Fe-S oxidoreductase